MPAPTGPTLAGSDRHYTNPDGTFNLTLWKSRIDAHRDVDFGPYVTEGILGLRGELLERRGWPSGIPGTASHPDQWQMSTAELVNVGTLLVQAPYAYALLSWVHASEHVGRPEMRAALDSVALLAATRGGTSRVRHDSTST
jgi:hypothetical protein